MTSPADIPPSEITSNGVRYLIFAAGDDDDGWDWSVESLPQNYDGCDGMCSYGCGADPWELRRSGLAWDYADTLLAAHSERAELIEQAEPITPTA